MWRLRWAPALVIALLAGQLTWIDRAAAQTPDREQSEAIRERLVDPSPNDVIVIAHRACWRLAPENSVAAIQACIRAGVDMVEIDVRRSKDDRLVIMHDDTLDRTTNGHGPVADYTLQELKLLVLKEGRGGSASPVTKERIPTLEEALSTVRNRILVNLDAKGSVRDAAFLLAKKMGVEDQVFIKMSMSSPKDFDLQSTQFFGNTFFMAIVRESNGPLQKQVASLGVLKPIAYEVIYESERQLGGACIEAASQHARCWVNTMWDSLSPGHYDDINVLDPANHWGYLVHLGVNMIQTDRPQALISYLESSGLRQR